MNLCNHCLYLGTVLYLIVKTMISNFIKNIKLERDVEIKRWIRNIEYTNAIKQNGG